MSKVILINDQHFGIRGDSKVFLYNQIKFLENIFFPEIKKRKIKTVLHLGDLVDRRKYINYNTARSLREAFLEPLESLGIVTHMILGNHDVLYYNTNSINAQNELIGNRYMNFKIHQSPIELKIDDLEILMVPWITQDNKQECLEAIEISRARVCCGHFEINDFEVHKGQVCDFGLSRDLFKKFDETYSGHFHHKSSYEGINYLGSTGEFTWIDYNDPKGFHILDTENLKLEFIRNPYNMFEKVYISKFHNDVKDKFVRFYIDKELKFSDIEKYTKILSDAGSYDIQIIEEKLNIDLDKKEEINIDVSSILDILVDSIPETDNKNEMQNFLSNLYLEAENMRENI